MQEGGVLDAKKQLSGDGSSATGITKAVRNLMQGTGKAVKKRKSQGDDPAEPKQVGILSVGLHWSIPSQIKVVPETPLQKAKKLVNDVLKEKNNCRHFWV